MIALSATDGQVWVLIISTVFGGIVSVLTLVFQQVNNKKTVEQRDRVEKEVKIVRINTNAALGESLRVAMISAHLLASQQPTPEYKKLAKEAEEKYLRHQT